MAKRIESIDDPERWKVYARGLTGKVNGLVFDNWFICDEIPPDARLIATGLDFGFTNDQTGCINVYRQNGELWIDELFYETRLTNKDIANKLTSSGVTKSTEIVADSAEPKSIEELKRLGWHINGAKKGADSINNSIDILKRYRLNITRRSVNLRTELNRYKWRVDKSGKALNEPVDTWNHLIDPLRYVALNKLKIKTSTVPKSRLPYLDNSRQNNLNDLMTI
jgi:phage terminase large subunit